MLHHPPGGPLRRVFGVLAALLVLAATAGSASALTTFHNAVGAFTVDCGYVTRLVLPDGTLATQDDADDFALNDPRHGGIGRFGWKWARGPYPWTLHQPGPSAGSRSLARCQGYGIVETRTMPQTYRYSETFGQFFVWTRWEFWPDHVLYVAHVRVRPSVLWLKEPEFVFNLNGALGITQIGGSCTYNIRETADPRRSTGHCEQPERHTVVMGGLRLEIDDFDFRRLRDLARVWPPAGDIGCGWRGFSPSWEFVSWGPDNGTSLLVKAWDGCVTPLDAPRFYRLPENKHGYRASVLISSQSARVSNTSGP